MHTPPLSQAYAGQVFTSQLLKAMGGASNIVECAFVENNLTAAPFFSSKIHLGPAGVEVVIPFSNLTEAEKAGVETLVPDLIAQANKGIEFVNGKK